MNVAVTRAREKIILITSIAPEQLNVTEIKNEGPKLLRKYLELRIERYEERIAMADWRRIEAPVVRMVARKE